MSELDRNETIKSFASAASMLVDQYFASEKAGWNHDVSIVAVSK